jgi:hypothetical protein
MLGVVLGVGAVIAIVLLVGVAWRIDDWLSASKGPLRCPQCGEAIRYPPSPGRCPLCGFRYHRWPGCPDDPPANFDPSRVDLQRFGETGRADDDDRLRTGADNLRENR